MSDTSQAQGPKIGDPVIVTEGPDHKVIVKGVVMDRTDTFALVHGKSDNNILVREWLPLDAGGVLILPDPHETRGSRRRKIHKHISQPKPADSAAGQIDPG